MILLVCLAAPVNGNLRYVLPIIMAIPINIAMAIYVARGNNSQVLKEGK